MGHPRPIKKISLMEQTYEQHLSMEFFSVQHGIPRAGLGGKIP